MNEWMGTGNLVRDPELSYTQQNQTARCVFTIACNRPRRNGEDQGADYIRVITWGKRAETCDRYLSKGRKVAVKGPLRTGSYKDKDGRTVYTTDVWAEEVEFLNSAQHDQGRPQVNVDEVQKQADDLLMPALYDLPDSFAAAEDDVPF